MGGGEAEGEGEEREDEGRGGEPSLGEVGWGEAAVGCWEMGEAVGAV